jgi:ferredoxin--NADP+ reductase
VHRLAGVPGEDLDGVHSATEFVGWYNGNLDGNPDYTDIPFDLSGERAVIIGNGNVALDVARILLADHRRLARTDITDHALAALAASNIAEVVVLGRRGPAQAGYTTAELLALLDLPGVDVLVDAGEAALDTVSRELLERDDAEPAARLKAALAAEISVRPSSGAPKRIVLRYLTSPRRIAGAGRVESIQLTRNSLVRNPDGSVRAEAGYQSEVLHTGLVLKSVGYRGSPVDDVPFDPGRDVIPNAQGRVLTGPGGQVVPRVYVAGWIKRGPSGVIGSNKACARETVRQLLADVASGVVTPAPDRLDLVALLRARQPGAIGFADWIRVDTAERLAGRAASRPRVKFVTRQDMLDVAQEGGDASIPATNISRNGRYRSTSSR